MSKKAAAIIGMGEVGTAIAQIIEESGYEKVLAKDLNFDETKGSVIDFLHICIPFNSSFVKNSVNEIKRLKPKLTVIHSTIAVGTTRKVFKKTGLPIVHSPIRGDHPHLAEHIKTFVKYVGPINAQSASIAEKYLGNMGIKLEIFDSPEETELAKLVDTTYFGWNILYSKFVQELCESLGLDYEKVYTHYNLTYNQGYRDVGRLEVVRPVIKKMPGAIGGHCVVPNIETLHGIFEHDFTKFMLEQNKKFGEMALKQKKKLSRSPKKINLGQAID